MGFPTPAVSHAAVDLASSSMAYYLVLETDGLMRLRDTANGGGGRLRDASRRGFRFVALITT